MSFKILLIEDDQSLGESLVKYLKNEGFSVHWCLRLSEAKEKMNDLLSLDLILLDWMLPDGQGIDFLKMIRAQKNSVPVIMLTARTDLLDKVIGLESGSNDYMTKPFEPRELIARIRVQLRMLQQSESDPILIERKDLKIHTTEREVFYKNKEVYLTKMEFDLLKLFAENPGRPFSRDELLNKVWGFEFSSSTRTVDTHVLQLRQKFEEDLIETVRGIGYRFSKNA